jgi:hypothetical protein
MLRLMSYRQVIVDAFPEIQLETAWKKGLLAFLVKNQSFPYSINTLFNRATETKCFSSLRIGRHLHPPPFCDQSNS